MLAHDESNPIGIFLSQLPPPPFSNDWLISFSRIIEAGHTIVTIEDEPDSHFSVEHQDLFKTCRDAGAKAAKILIDEIVHRDNAASDLGREFKIRHDLNAPDDLFARAVMQNSGRFGTN